MRAFLVFKLRKVTDYSFLFFTYAQYRYIRIYLLANKHNYE